MVGKSCVFLFQYKVHFVYLCVQSFWNFFVHRHTFSQSQCVYNFISCFYRSIIISTYEVTWLDNHHLLTVSSLLPTTILLTIPHYWILGCFQFFQLKIKLLVTAQCSEQLPSSERCSQVKFLVVGLLVQNVSVFQSLPSTVFLPPHPLHRCQ